MLGPDALILLRDKNFLVFFFCSFLFAMPLAFYYIFANGYLTEVGMKNATGWMTLGQFSEIFFMLALPFFTKRFGIKKVLLLGLVTAAIRYGFLFTVVRMNISPTRYCSSAFCCMGKLRFLLRYRLHLCR